MILSQLRKWKINKKRIFLRADLNVPLENGTILNDFRLTSVLPTLDYLIEQNTMIILASHLGKPKNHEKEFSTEQLISWFTQRNYTIHFAPNITDVLACNFTPQCIILLENLRFFPGEEQCDAIFARQLAQTADYYVNDAFGTLHKHDCSISMLPYEFSENRRTIGFLVEKELKVFDKLLNNPKKPFLALLGGSKLEEKIPLIKNLLSIADDIFLCPALCFSFLKVLNKQIGKSLVEESIFSLCKEILYTTHNNVNLAFPQDYQIAINTKDGNLSYINAQQFPENAVGISIGPRTVETIKNHIAQAQTVFFNCAMGFHDRPETKKNTYAILRAMAQSKSTTIVAGGDSVETAFESGAANAISHLSTGGGAALAYLVGNQLPGLMPFEEH